MADTNCDKYLQKYHEKPVGFQIIQNNLEDHIEKIGDNPIRRDVGKEPVHFRGYHATECERQTNHPIVTIIKICLSEKLPK